MGTDLLANIILPFFMKLPIELRRKVYGTFLPFELKKPKERTETIYMFVCADILACVKTCTMMSEIWNAACQK